MTEPVLNFTNSPGMPLFPLSPERVNSTRSPHIGSAPQSPSRTGLFKSTDFSLNPGSPERPRHSRNNSEALVQGMVARFDSLSLKDHQQMHKRDEVAIKREQMAREMAELELVKVRREREELEADNKRHREEGRRFKKEIEEGKERDRKLMKRLAAQEDDLERSTQTQEHQRTLMEKEIRKLRKEAYKTQSYLLKSQEDLKSARNSLKVTQAGLEAEKAKSFKREQEAFTAEYKLVGLLEEVSKLRDRLKIVEEERNALKTSLKEEEVARIAAEGRIALPASQEGETDEFATPKKSPRKRILDLEDKENMTPRRTAKSVEITALQEELEIQRRLRSKAEDQVDFMKMECQFRCCSCRVAEQQGELYVHDDRFVDEMDGFSLAADLSLPKSTLSHISSSERLENPQTVDEVAHDQTEVQTLAQSRFERPEEGVASTSDADASIPTANDTALLQAEAPAPIPATTILNESQKTEKSCEIGIQEDFDNSVVRHTVVDTEMTEPTSDLPSSLADNLSSEADDVIRPQTPHGPQTPRFREVRTITTTTTIPLAFTPSSTVKAPAGHENVPQTPVTIGHAPTSKVPISPFPGTPGALRPDGTIDREAALEQIRLRRGRARSVAMGLATPKKQMVEGNVRRDISAPALKTRG